MRTVKDDSELEEIWNIFDALRNKQTPSLENKYDPALCEFCNETSEFAETSDRENRMIVCTKCGYVQSGTKCTPLQELHTLGKTRYDPMERFEYWINLAEGQAKIPKKLQVEIDKISTLSELKAFLQIKKNRIYRKYYASILRQWDDLFIVPLTNVQKESLRLNFAHINRTHDRSVQENTKRKKSLPHYTFLIAFLLKKIQRDDLAEHFFALRCPSIEKKYIKKMSELFL